MSNQTLRKVSIWIGVASAGAIPLVPVAYRWLYPPEVTKVQERMASLLSFGLGILGSMGDGIWVLVWTSGPAIVALLASVIAVTSAWLERETRRIKLICMLPVMMVVISYGLLVAIDV